jgi:predicted HTH transcriptional regulator
MKESQHTEWKESWRDDHLRWVCGFANAGGGALVIGRDDKGRVVGIADTTRLLEELPNKIRDLLGIVVEVNLRSEGDAEYVEVEPITEAGAKTSVKILQAILENAEITIADLADRVGITTRSVERNIRKLQEEKRLRRIGRDKGGHWEVLK